MYAGDDPGTPGTDITHKSVLNITPSVKIEHDIMSDMGARNAGVCFFVYIIASGLTERSERRETQAPPAPILLTNQC